MKEIWRITRLILGIALILVGAYITIQTQFIVRFVSGQLVDGFGITLTENGHQYLLNDIVIWGISVIIIGGGLGLLVSTRKKPLE